MADLTADGFADVSPADGEVDDSRRKFLLRATVGMGAVGVAFHGDAVHRVVVTLGAGPRAGRTHDGGHDQDRAGQMIITIWRRQPIYVVHRTAPMLGLLGNHDDRLKDATSADSDQPAYCKNPIRSRNAEYLVLIGICTHLGCLPKQRFDAGDPQLGATWPGGWLCPCHGSRFDMAGRVFDGSPASVNLRIPPYTYPTPAQACHWREMTAARGRPPLQPAARIGSHCFCDLHGIQRRALEQLIARAEQGDRMSRRIAHILADTARPARHPDPRHPWASGK